MLTLKNIDVKNKKVILRVDYNVPIKDGKILDINKIVASLDTINYLKDQNSIGGGCNSWWKKIAQKKDQNY